MAKQITLQWSHDDSVIGNNILAQWREQVPKGMHYFQARNFEMGEACIELLAECEMLISLAALIRAGQQPEQVSPFALLPNQLGGRQELAYQLGLGDFYDATLGAIRGLFNDHQRVAMGATVLAGLPAIPIAGFVTINIIGVASLVAGAWVLSEAAKEIGRVSVERARIAGELEATLEANRQRIALGQEPVVPEFVKRAAVSERAQTSPVSWGLFAVLSAAMVGGAYYLGRGATSSTTTTSNPRRAIARRSTRAPSARKAPARKKVAAKRTTKNNPAKGWPKGKTERDKYLRSAMRKGRTRAQAEADWKRRGKKRKTRKNPVSDVAVRTVPSKKTITRKAKINEKVTVKQNPKHKRTTKDGWPIGDTPRAKFFRKEKRKGASLAQAKARWKGAQRFKKTRGKRTTKKKSSKRR